MKLFTIIFTLIFSFVASCSIRKLDLERKDYFKNDIRLDGFYYSKANFSHFFLYRNGVMFNAGMGFADESLLSLEAYYMNTLNYKNCYILPYYWGVFQINNKDIVFEGWRSGDEFSGYPIIKFEGEIYNDTTLVIYHLTEIIDRDTFYFHQYSPKPDSTNIFIK